jgi:hypothetical protein
MKIDTTVETTTKKVFHLSNLQLRAAVLEYISRQNPDEYTLMQKTNKTDKIIHDFKYDEYDENGCSVTITKTVIE